MLRTLVLLLLCYFASQNICAQISLKGQVVDASTAEPLPYATLAFGSVGAYANEDGYFSIKLKFRPDSMEVSYVGYSPLTIAIEDLKIGEVIRLQPSVSELDEVTVLANNEYLYTLINDCRKQLRKWPSTIAKGYFQLATTMDSYPVEVMQTYYNIVATGAGLEELQLKAGRIANHPTDSLFYRSLGTSQGLMALRLWKPSRGFAPHPLQLEKAKLKKSYQLTQRPDLSDANTIHIQFDADSKAATYFSGEIWINKETKDLQKLILRHDSLTEYPFFPLRTGDKLGSFDIELTYTFVEQRLQQIQWRYDYNHRVVPFGEIPKDRAMMAEGVLLSFDPNEPFYRPRYNISGDYGDYQKISFFPYDSVFWSTAPNIPLTQKQERQLAIFTESAESRVDFTDDLPEDDPYAAFSRGNLFWQADSRIAHSDSTLYKEQMKKQTVTTYFKLKPVVQLFLDVNPTENSLRYNTSTVFDVFSSQIEEVPSSKLNAALNIYFDLCEMIRREMEEELMALPRTEEMADRVYNKHFLRMDKMGRRFWTEVDVGENRKKMEYYNDLVYDELKINNLLSYNLYKFAAPEGEIIRTKKKDQK